MFENDTYVSLKLGIIPADDYNPTDCHTRTSRGVVVARSVSLAYPSGQRKLKNK